MTYRNNGSYLRFRTTKTLGKEPTQSSEIMNWLMKKNRFSNHVQDQPAVTSTTNDTFETME